MDLAPLMILVTPLHLPLRCSQDAQICDVFTYHTAMLHGEAGARYGQILSPLELTLERE